METYNLRTKLHIEVLRERYGNIDVHVLRYDDQKREVLLMDEHRIARTYALTLKKDDWKQNKEIAAVNDAIKKGMGIGIAFKKAGFEIQKNVLDVYITKLPARLQQAFRTKSKTAKTRITEFIVRKDNLIYNYGTVIEIYSPDFRKPRITEADKSQINIPVSALRFLGFSKEEIWMSLQNKIIAPYLAKLYSSVITDIKMELAASSMNFFHTDPELVGDHAALIEKDRFPSEMRLPSQAPHGHWH